MKWVVPPGWVRLDFRKTLGVTADTILGNNLKKSDNLLIFGPSNGLLAKREPNPRYANNGYSQTNV